MEKEFKKLNNGRNGRCGICKKTFKKGEEWHFQDMTGNPDNVIKEAQHWDCENPSYHPFKKQ